METFNAHTFALTLALVGVVIIIAGLLSGLIERSGMPQVAVFLALGAILGPFGLGLLNVTLDSPLLRIVATLSLSLVLFTDAVGLDIREARRHSGLALLVLGPGTMFSAALIAFAGWGLLGLSSAGAAILGAALASTDPVLLPVFARSPGSERLFALCCLVVLVSVALHGGSLMALGRGAHPGGEAEMEPTEADREPSGEASVPEAEETAHAERADGAQEGLPEPDSERITITDLRRLWESGALVYVLDTRSERTFAESGRLARDAIRIPPERAVEQVRKRNLSPGAWLVAFCA